MQLKQYIRLSREDDTDTDSKAFVEVYDKVANEAAVIDMYYTAKGLGMTIAEYQDLDWFQATTLRRMLRIQNAINSETA